MTIDGNLNWVKVTVSRPDELERVHAAVANRLVRPKLRPPVSDREIVISFDDFKATEASEIVAGLLEEEFGSVDWIQVEVGHGNLKWMYGHA
jgi:hypothetical protein